MPTHPSAEQDPAEPKEQGDLMTDVRMESATALEPKYTEMEGHGGISASDSRAAGGTSVNRPPSFRGQAFSQPAPRTKGDEDSISLPKVEASLDQSDNSSSSSSHRSRRRGSPETDNRNGSTHSKRSPSREIRRYDSSRHSSSSTRRRDHRSRSPPRRSSSSRSYSTDYDDRRRHSPSRFSGSRGDRYQDENSRSERAPWERSPRRREDCHYFEDSWSSYNRSGWYRSGYERGRRSEPDERWDREEPRSEDPRSLSRWGHIGENERNEPSRAGWKKITEPSRRSTGYMVRYKQEERFGPDVFELRGLRQSADWREESYVRQAVNEMFSDALASITHVGVFLSGKGRRTTTLFITFESIAARDQLDETTVQLNVAPYLDEGPPPWAASRIGREDGGGAYASFHGKERR